MPTNSIGPELSLAGGTDPIGRGPSDSDQDRLVLADIEARLTDEVLRLVGALREFGCGAQLISESTPVGADFTKLVTQTVSLMGFQLANALLKSVELPVLRDDGVLYLKNLGINLHELFREIELDGRRFMAVALIDEKLGQLGNSAGAGEQR